jgi:hypothetical protein
MTHGNDRTDVGVDVADGIRAYSAKQAHLNRRLADSFRKRWESKEGHAADWSGEDSDSADDEGDGEAADSDVDVD